MRICYCVKSWTGHYDVERCEERDHWMMDTDPVIDDPVKDDLFIDQDPDPIFEDDLFIDHDPDPDPIMPSDPDPIMPEEDPGVDMEEALGYEGPTFDTETHR